MYKKRVIPVLLLKHGLIVRSESFFHHQLIGDPVTQLKRYDQWQVDELIYLDISEMDEYDVGRNDASIATWGKKDIRAIVSEIARHSFMPLTFGGRIRTLQDVRERLESGADKVTLNTQAVDTPEIVTEASGRFGSQCIVVSIDVKSTEAGWEVYKGGRTPTGMDPVVWAMEMEKRGAGEILLNSMDRDGVGTGYDLGLLDAVVSSLSIPVIALGGVGHWSHMVQALQKTNVSAVAAANKFHFTEMSYAQAKKYLLKHELSIRIPLK